MIFGYTVSGTAGQAEHDRTGLDRNVSINFFLVFFSGWDVMRHVCYDKTTLWPLLRFYCWMVLGVRSPVWSWQGVNWEHELVVVVVDMVWYVRVCGWGSRIGNIVFEIIIYIICPLVSWCVCANVRGLLGLVEFPVSPCISVCWIERCWVLA